MHQLDIDSSALELIGVLRRQRRLRTQAISMLDRLSTQALLAQSEALIDIVSDNNRAAAVRQNDYSMESLLEMRMLFLAYYG